MKLSGKKSTNSDKLNISELEWGKKEQYNIESRIIRLRVDQIGALLNLVGLNFNTKDIEDVVQDIVMNGHSAGHLTTLMSEADSKENLLWWIEFFERANTKK